jgi:hypothetical protein
VKRKNLIRTLVAGAAVAAMAVGGGAAYAATQTPAITGGPVTGIDHLRFTFTLAPGGSQVLHLPAVNDPIRIDLDNVSTNGGVQTPSEVFSALINDDRNNAGMSWVGTWSDGTQHANSTIHSPIITKLTCGGSCVIAQLDVASIPGHTVILRTNAATSIIRETYVVNIWF